VVASANCSRRHRRKVVRSMTPAIPLARWTRIQRLPRAAERGGGGGRQCRREEGLFLRTHAFRVGAGARCTLGRVHCLARLRAHRGGQPWPGNESRKVCEEARLQV
jgi:hypothetical protein